MSENPSNGRKPLEFSDAPIATVVVIAPKPTAVAPNPQYLAFLEAAKAEAQAEREAQEQLEREPLAWQIKDGRAAGPFQLTKIRKGALKSVTAGAFPLDCGEMGEECEIHIVNPITRDAVKGKILQINRNDVLLSVSPTNWEPTDGVNYFIRKESANFAGPYVQRLSSLSNLQWPRVLPPGELPCPIPEGWSVNGINFLECLKACLTFRGIGAIKGPPGTGKTYLLGHVAALLAEAGFTVIIAALSHDAVNNALNKTAEICLQLPGKPKPIKRADKAGKRLNVGILPAQALQGEDTFADYKIIGMTLASLIRAGKMAKADFIFLEEAGQISAFQAAALSSAGENMLLFGDEQQLEPILQAKQRNVLNSAVSAMEFIRRSYPDRIRTLTANHRSNTATVNFTRRHHYPTVELEAATNAISKLSENVEVVVEGKKITLPESGMITIPIEHVNRNKACPEEADVCVQIVQSLMGKTIITPDGERELTTSDFAVLSPNKLQAQMVMRQFGRIPAFAEKTLLCGTIHKLQGQGIPIVIFSITASHKGYIEKTAEFLFNPSMWNVATSRATTLCVILGNRESLERCRPKTLKGMGMKQKAMLQLEDEL